MNILMSGCNGLIGSMLRRKLEENNHEVKALVRAQPGAACGSDEIGWDSSSFIVHKPEQLIGTDAVIHLAGEPVLGRWTSSKKQMIYQSRVVSTAALTRVLATLPQKPKTVIVASAIGYFGDRGSRELTEEDGRGDGFLAHVCADWEEAAYHARDAGIRVVHVRFGVVLSPKGGALKKMLPAFKLGLGGRLGPGTQYMSWISLDDAIGGILFCLNHEAVSGPVNLVAPNPVTNQTFTDTLSRALRRPALLPAPAFVLKAILGEMALEVLLASTCAKPARLLQSGYIFKHTDLATALADLLAKP